MLNRRIFLASLGVWGVASCGGTPPSSGNATTGPLPPDLRPQANPGFSQWVAAFRPRALARGVFGATFDAAFARAGYLPGVVSRDRNQIQTRRTLEDYLSIATSNDRLAKGRAALARHGQTLAAIESRYGVEAEVVAAIWGMESQFGEKRGKISVVSSTASLAFSGRRAKFWEDQLVAALRILQRGDTTPANLVGSWAGAMGHTQFIPTSYQAFAVDFNGDGRRDIWSNDPTDALASTASYLARNGWRRGLKWGGEAGTAGVSGRTIQPQAGGVRFTVTRNFNVLKTYNNSDFYATAVGHLSDRLAGGGPLRGSFPPDADGLTKPDRMAIQRGLAARGYDIGTIDGVLGQKAEAAIRDFQAKRGLAVTGRGSAELLRALR